MQPAPERLTPAIYWLQDAGRLASLALVLVPVYLLCNDYWQSLLRLTGLYALLILFCGRLGGYMRRAMRRLPAEIPPWHAMSQMSTMLPGVDPHFATAETIRSVYKDPRYVQDVLKPRLRQLLVYRLSGTPDAELDTLDAARLAHVDPALLAFLQRSEPRGWWTRYGRRQQRLADALVMLHYLESL
jgi:hypothetical protein